jgi:hypothetical protein
MEAFMKKISRTIAVVLVLVMLASSFTGCFTFLAFKNGWGGSGYIWLDLLLIGLAIMAIDGMNIKSEAQPDDAQIYLASAENTMSTEYFSLMSRIYSVPEAASAMQNIGLLPGTERNALAERINSLPQEKRAALIRTLNSLPDAEIASSMERINAFSEEGFISMVRSYNSLSEDEFNSLVEEFNSLHKPENVAFDYNFEALPEMAVVSWGNTR